MKILRIEVQGFRSFVQPQSFDFTKYAPGLYYITGRNLLEPELGANGVGKSSLFEAVYWALRGTTTEGVKAGDVASWYGGQPCAVIADIETPAGPLSLFRVWKPNTLEISQQGAARPVQQAELDLLLGSSPEIFLHYAYFSQHAPLFVDLPPVEQTALFTSILNLELWGTAADKATALAGELDESLTVFRTEEARITGQLEELARTDYAAEERAWFDTRQQQIGELKEKQRLAVEAVRTARHESSKVKIDSAGVKKCQEELAQCRAEQRYAVSELTRLESELGKLRAKDIKTCPTCGAPVSSAHIQKEIKRNEDHYCKLREGYAALTPAVQRLEKQYGGYQASIDVQLQVEKAVGVKQTVSDHLREQMESLLHAINPYITAREQADKRGAELVSDLEALETAIVDISAHLGAAKFWIKGFKEIRLGLIKESLGQLTVEVNEVLDALGLHDWSIEFEVEKETKSGTIRRTFTTLIHSPFTDKAVPWEAWSGGERQRLRRAITLGFANLVAARQQGQCNVEFHDEPTTGLSPEGIDALLNVLADRAQRYGKAIFIADHRSLEFGRFAGMITIEKDAAGSRIVCSV